MWPDFSREAQAIQNRLVLGEIAIKERTLEGREMLARNELVACSILRERPDIGVPLAEIVRREKAAWAELMTVVDAMLARERKAQAARARARRDEILEQERAASNVMRQALRKAGIRR